MYTHTHTHTQPVVSARRLQQYFQLPDKNSRHISKHIYKFLRYFKIITYLFHYFSRNPKRYSAEPCVPRNPVWETLYSTPKRHRLRHPTRIKRRVTSPRVGYLIFLLFSKTDCDLVHIHTKNTRRWWNKYTVHSVFFKCVLIPALWNQHVITN